MITTGTINSSVDKNCQALTKGASVREKILASTVSVDEYFDELIDQVREDYASL